MMKTVAKKRTAVRADLLWKELLEAFLYPALEIFHPGLYAAADLAKPPVFLNKELRVPGLHKANREEKILDMLADVPLKTGDSLRVLLHVEVQAGGTKEPFHVRMHDYACVITLTQKRPFASLAIRTTPQGGAEKLGYEMDCFGTRHVFEYPTVFIGQLDEERLASKPHNPVGLAALCVKRMQMAKRDEKKRFQYGVELLTMMKEAGYSEDACLRLLQFIEGITNLSLERLRKEFEKEMDVLFGEAKPMQVRTPLLRNILRRRALEGARAEGIAEGIAEGEAKGIAEGKTETARRMLVRGMEVGLVADMTGLPEEEVRFLAQTK